MPALRLGMAPNTSRLAGEGIPHQTVRQLRGAGGDSQGVVLYSMP